jgi:hypothetical protein
MFGGGLVFFGSMLFILSGLFAPLIIFAVVFDLLGVTLIFMSAVMPSKKRICAKCGYGWLI